MNVLAIQIAGGYSSEARVFASLLGNRAGAYEALVLHQESDSDRQSISRFAADARVDPQGCDFGWRLSPPGGHKFSSKVTQLARLRRVLPLAVRKARAFHPDVVYSNQQHWDCYVAAYLAQKLKIPQVIHLHYIIGPWLRRQPLQRLRTCEHVVAVSDFIRTQVIAHGVPPERVTTVRNTMAPAPPAVAGTREAVRQEFHVEEGAPLVGIIARIFPGKGQDDTIAALSQIAGRFPKARLLVVGEGEILPQLKEFAASLGLGDRVVFTGRRSDVPRILAALDIFCHPSRQDPCPLAPLEAQAAGLPVIAYAEGGICEVVASGKTGILVAPGDIAALANAMTALIEDSKAARAMGAAATERIAQHFQPAVAGQDFAHLMRKIARE